MTEAATTIEYYQRFGLQRDPFPDNVIDNIFFLTPELKDRVELIKHLLEFSQQLLLVTGPAGAGKTTLCRYLPSSLDQKWIVSVADASELMDPEMLTRVSMEEIPGKSRPGNADADERMEKYLQFCDRDGMLPVLIIDQGQKLSIETLEFLVRLNALNVNNTRFRILIVAEPGINQTLDDPRIKASTAGIVHDISLPLLSVAQTSAYLQHRLSACGKVNPNPFTGHDAEHIYKVSGGAPGKINRLARQAMLDPEQLVASRMQKDADISHRWLTAIVLVLIASVAIAGFIYMNIANKTRVNDTEATVVLPVQASSDEVISETHPADTRDTTAMPAVNDLPEQNVVLETDAGDLYQEEIDMMLPQTQVTGPADTTTSAEETPALLSPQFAELRDASWIAGQAPDSYVLQLIGARDVKTLEKYLEQVPQVREQLAVLTTVNAGRPWYIFIYGLYADRAAAVADLANLPAAARSSDPWARPIASIQQDLLKVVSD